MPIKYGKKMEEIDGERFCCTSRAQRDMGKLNSSIKEKKCIFNTRIHRLKVRLNE